MGYITHISNNNIEDIYARNKINDLVDKVEKLSYAVKALCEVIRGLSSVNAIKINFYKKVYDNSHTPEDTDESYLGDNYRNAIAMLINDIPAKIDVDQNSNIF